MTESSPSGLPRFSLVSAVYGVERYLEEFIAAVEAQDFPLDRVEVVMVDDGSTDSAPRILAEWQERRPELVRVLTKPNGGTSSARNLGLEAARGEWVSFPDPDDTFAPTYLSEVEAMLVQHPEVAMVATNRILEHDPTGVREAHSLSAHFTTENRVRDLDGHPDFFHGSAPAAFFQHELLRRTALRFDERIRPSFEDGHFCVSYLLRARRPHGRVRDDRRVLLPEAG